MNKVFNMNAKTYNGSVDFNLSIVGGKTVAEQLHTQLPALQVPASAEVALHVKPETGAATVAYLLGLNKRRPVIALCDGNGVVQGSFDLEDFRQNLARERRFELGDDTVSSNAAIVIHFSSRSIPPHQIEQIKSLVRRDELVVVSGDLGQVDVTREDLGKFVCDSLMTALKNAGVGNSLMNRQVVVTTQGLSTVNTILVESVHALKESYPLQPVATPTENVWNIVEMVGLNDFQEFGREMAAKQAPVQIGKLPLAILAITAVFCPETVPAVAAVFAAFGGRSQFINFLLEQSDDSMAAFGLPNCDRETWEQVFADIPDAEEAEVI